MNKLNFNQSVGFPLDTDILTEMQKAYTLLNALGAISGNFSIISGCTLTGSTVSDGTVYINGELLEFKGGLAQTNVIIVEIKTALEFEDTSTHDVVFTRHVTFGTATTQWAWSSFKRGLETKEIPEALAAKVPLTAFDAVVLRIAELEKKNAIFQTGGGMVLWNKAANLIPMGWSEVVDWRGRIPAGMDVKDTDFDTIGKNGGSKTSTVTIPLTGYGVGANTSAGVAGTLIVSTGDNEIGEAFESIKKAGTVPTGGTVNHMNPYRTVLFIEYTTPTV
jgi:hypothetical protein